MEHEAQPHQGDQHQLIEKEVGDHGKIPSYRETVARAPGCPSKTFIVKFGSEPLSQEGNTMYGPGEYRPDSSAGITAPADLPQPEIVPYSRNDIRQSCPRCGHSAYRDKQSHRTLHDLGNLDLWCPRDLVITYSQHYCLKFCKVRWMAYSGGHPSAHAAPSGPYGGCLYANHCGLSHDRTGSLDGLWRCV